MKGNTYTALSVLLGNTAAATSGGGGGLRAGGGLNAGGGGLGSGGGLGAAARRRHFGGRARRLGRRRRATRRGAATRLDSTLVGRADRAGLDVRELNSRTRVVGLDICGLSGSDRASTAGNTWLGGIGVRGIRRVEPMLKIVSKQVISMELCWINYHVNLVVVPERHDEDHALLQCFAHSLQATGASEVVVVSEDGLLLRAEFVGDGVTGDTSDIGLGLLEDLATLDVYTADLSKVASVGAVGGDELSHNGDRLLSVDRLTRTVEGLVAHAEGVEVATVSVAVSVVSVAIARAAGRVGGAGAVAGNT
jgi:hypothetical protein